MRGFPFRTFWVLSAILSCFTWIKTASAVEFSLSGYAKYIFSSSESPLVEDRLSDHLLHVRVNTRWYPAQWLTVAADLRMRGFYGDSVENLPGFTRQMQAEYDYADLDAELWDEQRTFGYAEIDRLFLDAAFGNWQLTAGRQRIAWGTSLVWNISDLFNPMSILDFDYEERPGSDAFRLQYFTGPMSRIETVVKPGTDTYHQTFASLWALNAWGYDFFAIAAQHHHRKLLGGAWAGQIKDGGFRGELTLSDPPSDGQSTQYPVDSSLGSDLTSWKKTTVSAVLSGDYMFANSFYVHTEVLFNSNGKTSNAGAFWQQAAEIGLLSPARWSLYQEVAYEFHPLVRGNLFMLLNPTDRSAVFAPSLTWNLSPNLDFTMIGFWAAGKTLTEFGDTGQSAYLRLKYAF